MSQESYDGHRIDGHEIHRPPPRGGAVLVQKGFINAELDGLQESIDCFEKVLVLHIQRLELVSNSQDNVESDKAEKQPTSSGNSHLGHRLRHSRMSIDQLTRRLENATRALEI